MRTTSLLLAAVFMVPLSSAQERTNPRGVGMGRTVNATSIGIETFGVNPARLGLPENRTLDIGMPAFGFQLRTELFSYDIYNEYFTGVPGPNGDRIKRVLTREDKDRILSLIPEDAGTWATMDVTPFAMAIQNDVVGGMGFSITDHIGVLARLSREYFKMFAFGLDSSGSLYDFGGTGFTAWYWREYAFSYGREIPVKIPFVSKWYAGFSYKMVRGYGLFETLQYATTFGTVPDGNQYLLTGNASFHMRGAGIDMLNKDKNAAFSPFPEPAGRGTALDFGISAELAMGINVSAALVNLGSIDWDLNVVETKGEGDISISNIFSDQGTDSLEERLRGKNEPGAPFNSPLPSQLRIGASLRSKDIPFLRWIPGTMLIALDYTQGFNEAMGNTTTPRFSLGTEYRLIPLIPLWTGIAVGGDDSFRWSAGLGLDLHFLSLSFATENFGILFSPSNFQMAQFTFGLRLKV